jgi:hypothetical protein
VVGFSPYFNEHHPWELYQKIFFNLYESCHKKMHGRKKFCFKNKLVSLDATVIDPTYADTGKNCEGLSQTKEEQAMWLEATRVAIIGFSVVFIGLFLLALSVKVMSILCRSIERKGGKKS